MFRPSRVPVEIPIMLARVTLTALTLVLGTTFGSLAGASEGCAGYGGYGGGCGYGWGYGIGVGGLYNGLDRYSDYRVPYFAAHPPVYYSHPVPRTYGHSPFAYPPHFRTPEIAEPIAPITITNPYVPASDKPAADAGESDETVSAPAAPKPLVVMNPYVVGGTLADAGR